MTLAIMRAFPKAVHLILVARVICLTLLPSSFPAYAQDDTMAPTKSTHILDIEKQGSELRNRIETFYNENKGRCGANGRPLILEQNDLEISIPVDTAFIQAEAILRAAGFKVHRPPITGWEYPFTGASKFMVTASIYPIEQRLFFLAWVSIILYPYHPNEYTAVAKISGAIYCNSL